MFNPRAQVEVVPIDATHACYVVDDALAEPERWVARAAEHRDAFEDSPHNAYPGPELRMPAQVTARLDVFFAEHVRARLGVRRTIRSHSRLALATRAPHELDPRQWICHRDRLGMSPVECASASVLYLFRDVRLGGTSFFAPRRPIAEIERLVDDSASMRREVFAARYGIAAGYLTASNAWFEKLATIPPRFNRLIFYDGSLFHGSDIAEPSLLSPDPRVGRLTLNGFFVGRRPAH